MSFKCPDCGASLTDDSKFCKYCGAKIDDGVKRMEIKIDKRIEDVAEVKRAGYEEQESRLRQKKMEREYKARSVKRVLMLSLLIIGAAFAIPIFIINLRGPWAFIGVIAFYVAVIMAIAIVYQLIKGKW